MRMYKITLLSGLFFYNCLIGSSPIVNRYFPHVSASVLPSILQGRSSLSLRLTAGHAAKTFARVRDESKLHRKEGILELLGDYDLDSIVDSLTEKISAEGGIYTAPYARETGGHAWASRSLIFGAHSSLLKYQALLVYEQSFGEHWRVTAQLPLIHVEARERYEFPVQSSDQTLTLSDREQVRRLRRYVHSDLGLKTGDWWQDGLGDASMSVRWLQRWKYVGVLRSCGIGAQVAVSAPTGVCADRTYPASVSFGNDGHWGGSVSILPEIEVKEGWHINLPFSFTLQSSKTHTKRIPVYKEPAPFSPLEGSVKITPGVTLQWAPGIMVEHLFEDFHFMLGFVYTKHWIDKWIDMRANKDTVVSYLTRTPSGSITAALIAQNQYEKKMLSKWRSSYVVFDAHYILRDFFPRLANPPVLRLAFDYCLSGAKVARMHQVSAQLSWRF